MRFLSIASDFFTTLGEIMSSVGSFMVALFNSVLTLFYTPAGEGTEGGFTVFGIIFLISVAFGIFIWGFNFVRRLLKIGSAR